MELEIICHDGSVYHVNVDEYNPMVINEQLNNNEVLTVAIGDKIFSRIDIKRIIPRKEL
jgi:hypothetical protein